MIEERVKEWPKQWMAEGYRKGIQEGRQEGIEEGRRSLTRLLGIQLELKFGPLATEEREQIQGVSIETLEIWSRRVLTARSLQEIFAD